MGLGPTVGILRLAYLFCCRVNMVVALSRPGNSIGIIQPGIEPLGRVGCTHLRQQHIDHFIIKRLSILRCVKISMFLTPLPPAAGKTVNHLFHGILASHHHIARLIPQEFARDISLRHARLSEIFLGENIRRHLRPMPWNLNLVHFKYL